jgi:hypothetical protein
LNLKLLCIGRLCNEFAGNEKSFLRFWELKFLTKPFRRIPDVEYRPLLVPFHPLILDHSVNASSATNITNG